MKIPSLKTFKAKRDRRIVADWRFHHDINRLQRDYGLKASMCYRILRAAGIKRKATP